MIVKIQRPLWQSRGEAPRALVYSEGRTFEALLPFEGDLVELFEGEEALKVYAEAHLRGTILHVDRVLTEDEEPDW